MKIEDRLLALGGPPAPTSDRHSTPSSFHTHNRVHEFTLNGHNLISLYMTDEEQKYVQDHYGHTFNILVGSKIYI